MCVSFAGPRGQSANEEKDKISEQQKTAEFDK